MGELEWVLVLPAKPATLAKSRLGADGVPAPLREQLAVAFALDTLATAVTVAGPDRVVVMSDDPVVAGQAVAAGVPVLADLYPGDLNRGLLHAAELISDDDHERGLLVLVADLPALTAGELAEALGQVHSDPASAWFAADAATTGTTLYAALPRLFAPQFGPGSAARHRAAGAREIRGPLPGLRRDIDDLADLAAAESLGLGRYSRDVLGSPHR